jgi:hypothetical protein
VNRPSDVTFVQQCLNAIPETHGRPGPLLKVDGKCGPKTVAAVKGFQLHQFGWKLADGRVDPAAGGFTGFINSGLVVQVYCAEASQSVLRPATHLARLAFHEMTHGKIDVGPSPPGRHPRTEAPVTDIHAQGGGGLAQHPTPPSAVLTPDNRDIMAHNLRVPVPMHVV